jgi:hypothetical protein
MPRSRLEREYVLNALLATFIRAIRVGVINTTHSAIVLAHYDHLGSGFDTNIKVVIDFLRDLGMFRGQGHIVAEVVTRALQEVRISKPTTCGYSECCFDRHSVFFLTMPYILTIMLWAWHEL